MKTQRRTALKKLFTSLLGVTGLGLAAKAHTNSNYEKEVQNIVYDQDVPLFSQITKLGNLVFIAGQGYHFEGDIKLHTDHVLKSLEEQLIKAGSSMEKVLKVSVFLNDIKDYQGMNEVFKGRFGSNPPVRTTVAVAQGGVPGNSLVEMDCMAYF
jgi:2-iminobutanoate/2-iminopropanoate deaminase